MSQSGLTSQFSEGGLPGKDFGSKLGKLRLASQAFAADATELISVKEAAGRLGVARGWLYRHRNELPHLYVGRGLRFDWDRLLAFLQSRRGSSTVGREAGNRLRPKVEVEMGRKRFQQGCIFRAGSKKKVWRARWRVDVLDAEGNMRRVQRHVTLGSVTEIPSRTAARERLAVLMAEDGNRGPKVDIAFEELATRWQQNILPTLKPPTADYYRKLIAAHLLPVFSGMKLSEIGRYEVQQFLTGRSRRYTRNSLRGMRVALGRLLGWAAECGWVEENVCRGTLLPRGIPGRVRARLSEQDVERLAAALKEPYRTLVLFLAITGARISEAIGLRFGDLGREGLLLERRIYAGQVDIVKTDSSERCLPVPDLVRALLLSLRNGSGDGWIFRTHAGTPLIPGNALRRHVKPAAKRLGIPLCGWHDLRHALASWASERGWSPKLTASILGHSDVRTTLQIYTHTTEAGARRAMEEIAQSLLRNTELFHDVPRLAHSADQPAVGNVN